MTAEPSIHIFSWLLDGADTVLNHYVTDTSQGVIHAITPVATTLFLIYVLMWAFAHLRNQIEEPVTDGAMRMVKWGIIVMLALNVTYYGAFVVDFAMNTPTHLIAAINNQHLNTYQSGIGQVLDETMNAGFDVGNRIWLQGGLSNIGAYIVAIIVWAAVVLILLFVAALLLIANIAMAVLLAVGPIFILLLLFKGTQRFFELWLGQVVNFMLMILLTMMASGLVVTILNKFIAAQIASPASSAVVTMVQMLALGGVGVLILRQVPSIASALGGGVALGTLGGFGATMRGAHGGIGKLSGRATRQEAARQRRAANAAKYNNGRKAVGRFAGKAAMAVPGVGQAAAVASMASKAFRAKNTVRRG